MTCALGRSSCIISSRLHTAHDQEHARDIAPRPIDARYEAGPHRIVAAGEDDRDHAGRRWLFSSTRLPPSQWKTHQRCHRAAARGVQAADQNPTVLPSTDTAAILFWAVLPRSKSPPAS